MFLIKILLFILLCFQVANSTNSQWSQCGGENWSSSSDCVSGYTCYVQDRYYAQCRPTNDCPSGWNCSVYVPPPVSNNTNLITAWGQCGGQNWNSYTACVYGYICYIQDQYYAQCRPANDCPAGWNCSINSNNNNNNQIINTWGQCGGLNFSGTGNCTNGDFCYIKDAYYSQCRPVNDCPSGWSCFSQTSVFSTNSKQTTSTTTSFVINKNCSSVQFFNANTLKCQDKGNYAKYCTANNQCKSELGLICRNHKYICNCPLVYVGYRYCDCNWLNYYSYSARKCGKNMKL